MSFKLTIDVAPSYITILNQSLYRCLTKRAWEHVRQMLLQKYQFRCAACGADEKGLNCHEVWSFSVADTSRKLLEVLPLCKMCHAVRHMDSPRFQQEDIGFGFDRLREHFMRVNGCSLEEFDNYYQQHQKEVKSLVYSDGSVILGWETDYGEYSSILAQPGNLKKGIAWQDGYLISSFSMSDD